MFYIFKINSGIFLASVISCLAFSVSAQITPDGSTSTTVNVNGESSIINNGDSAGTNLFHSFQDFSVGEGNEAVFNNTTDITNIFSRVTGGNISNIDGLVSTNNANLFLINPAGIIFGAEGRLNLGTGSFYGSTAESILFDDGEFSATDVENSPVLTVNAPIGLNFRDNSASIEVNNSNLELASGTSLFLIGGDINLNNASFNAPEGNIQLGGLSTAGTVDFIENLSLNFANSLSKSDINLNNNNDIDVRGVNGSINIDAHNLTLANESSLKAGISETMSAEAQAGNIELDVTEAINISDSSTVENIVEMNAIGNSGDINIQAGSLNINNRSLLNTSIFGEGNAGNININASQGVTINGSNFSETEQGIVPSSINSQLSSRATGSAGNIAITANSLFISDGAELNTSTFGNGDGGNITLNINEDINLSGFSFNDNNTRILSSSIRSVSGVDAMGDAGEIKIFGNSFLASNRAEIEGSSFGEGSGGNIAIDIEDNINLASSSSISSNVNSLAFGNAGDINVQAGSLTLDGGSQIGTAIIRAGENPLGGMGNGGNITINATDSVNISGIGLEQLELPDTSNATGNTTGLTPTAGFSSGLISSAEPGSIGDAGNIVVTTGSFNLEEGGIVSSETNSPGRGGDIFVSANTFNLVNGGQVLASSAGSGDSGAIQLNISDHINISGIDQNFETRLATANEFGPILGGENIVGNQGAESGIFANTNGDSTGEGGSISIGIFQLEDDNLVLDNTKFTESLTVEDRGRINATSEGQGRGGEIFIQTKNLTLRNQAQIIAETNFSQPAEIIPSEINLSVANNIILQENSSISAQAFNNANGGNINIEADFIIAFPSQLDAGGNDIIANAFQGSGGNININARSLFGIQERSLNDLTNDINASSRVSGLDGSVNINTPDINPVQGTSELPVNVVEPEQNTSQTCRTIGQKAEKNSLVIVGKGGIALIPTKPFNSDNIIIKGEITNTAPTIPDTIETSQGKIRPARGIKMSESGSIVLTAYQTNSKSHRLAKHKRNCV